MPQKILSDFYYQEYLFSFDKSKIQLNIVHQYLSEESYWAKNIPIETVKRSIENSICMSIYDNAGLVIGFGRMITDEATFGYLADVFVLGQYRGKGLSKIMVDKFCKLADDFGLRRFMLATLDAHGLYTQYGFEALSNPERIMARKGATY